MGSPGTVEFLIVIFKESGHNDIRSSISEPASTNGRYASSFTWEIHWSWRMSIACRGERVSIFMEIRGRESVGGVLEMRN